MVDQERERLNREHSFVAFLNFRNTLLRFDNKLQILPEILFIKWGYYHKFVDEWRVR